MPYGAGPAVAPAVRVTRARGMVAPCGSLYFHQRPTGARRVLGGWGAEGLDALLVVGEVVAPAGQAAHEVVGAGEDEAA